MNAIAPPGLTLTLVGDTEILISRHLKGSPEQVYRAHTEPDLIPKWLGSSDGWTMPVCISEARAGGHFRFEWAGKDGNGFYATGEYIAVTPFSRLEHVERMFLPDRTPENHIVTEFVPEGSGTRLTLRMILPDLATRDAILASGMTDGYEDCYARIDSLTADMPA